MRSERTNAGKIRNAAKTKISGSREAERNTGREVSVGGYFYSMQVRVSKPIQGFRSLMK